MSRSPQPFPIHAGMNDQHMQVRYAGQIGPNLIEAQLLKRLGLKRPQRTSVGINKVDLETTKPLSFGTARMHQSQPSYLGVHDRPLDAAGVAIRDPGDNCHKADL